MAMPPSDVGDKDCHSAPSSFTASSVQLPLDLCPLDPVNLNKPNTHAQLPAPSLPRPEPPATVTAQSLATITILPTDGINTSSLLPETTPPHSPQASAPLSPQATLDPSAFPHIIRTIMTYTDLPTRLALRQANRTFGAEMDSIFFKHVVVIVWWDGTVALRAYRGPGFPYDFQYVTDGKDKQSATDGGDGSQESQLVTKDSGHKPQLTPVLELPPRVVELLKYVKTLDLVGHFELMPPFWFLAPVLAILDAIGKRVPSGSRRTLHKLRLIPDPFGRYPWRGTNNGGCTDPHQVPVPLRRRGEVFSHDERLQLKKLANTTSLEIICSLWCYALEKAETYEAEDDSTIRAVFRWFDMCSFIHMFVGDVGHCKVVALETVPQLFVGGNSITGVIRTPPQETVLKKRSLLDILEPAGNGTLYCSPCHTSCPFEHVTHKEYTALCGPQEFDDLVKLAAERSL